MNFGFQAPFFPQKALHLQRYNTTIMMKRILLALLAVVGVATARGTVYDYFVVSQLDGTELSLPVDGLVITFSNDHLVATSPEGTERVALSQLAAMRFSETPSGISALDEMQASALLSGRTLTVNAPEGSRVTVADVSGRLVVSTVLNDGRLSVGLRPGVYVVRMNEKSQKICVR